MMEKQKILFLVTLEHCFSARKAPVRRGVRRECTVSFYPRVGAAAIKRGVHRHIRRGARYGRWIFVAS